MAYLAPLFLAYFAYFVVTFESNLEHALLMKEVGNSADGERTFGNIVAGATAVSFALVFGSLACVGRNSTGALDFQWHWTALIWMVTGGCGGWYFWKLAWWS